MIIRVLFGSVVLGALAFASFADEPKEKPFKPLLIISGSHSAVQKDQLEICTTEVEWDVVWEKHRGEGEPRFTEKRQRLEIDFGTHYVVAVFTRDKQECAVTTFERGDEVLVRYDAYCPQIAGRVGGKKRTKHQDAKEEAVAAYAFVVLPKPVRTVVMEQGSRVDLDHPLVWKEQKRFPAPGNKK